MRRLLILLAVLLLFTPGLAWPASKGLGERMFAGHEPRLAQAATRPDEEAGPPAKSPAVLKKPDQAPPPPPRPKAKEVVVGGIFDITGQTSALGRDYAQGAVDAATYINQNGGVHGVPLRLITRDFGYEVPKAIKLYKKYKHVDKAFVILGWGFADTRALAPLINKDKIVFMSADFSAPLNDPKKRPYNFFIGSSYSDQIRMAMRYAKENGGTKVCFIYPEHPYGQAPIPAGKEYALKLGLQIGPDVSVGLRATDATPQLLHIKGFAPDFVWLGGTTPSVAIIIKDAVRLGLKGKFLINTWGIDEHLSEAAGNAAQGRALGFIPIRPFGYEAPETSRIRSITGDKTYRRHYNLAWASMMVLWEGLKRVSKFNGPSLKAALETLKDFETGGLTPPLTFTPDDHRATTTCGLYTVKEDRLSLVTDVSIDRLKEYLGR